MSNEERLLYLNGLNATTKGPLVGPVSYEALSQRVLDEYGIPDREKDQAESFAISESYKFFDEYKLDDPAQAGWGLLVHADEAEAMKDQLADLIQHRNGRILLYQGEDVREWKEQNYADAINPEKFPYYVLIAGSPSKVPFELQFSLDVQQSVGRIDFDSPDDYARYARTIVDYETGATAAPGKRAVFFAPRHDGDYPTTQSESRMVRPLLDQLPQSAGVPQDLVYDALRGPDATKENLKAALQADASGKTPALLFSASHGIGMYANDPNQRTLQGSIVCQDYEFPLTPQQRKGFVSGYDVEEEGFALPGGIHFFFACFGAGTRKKSDFARYMPDEKDRAELEAMQGKEAFTAFLPKRLLANPKGGALAVIGHVDPAWIHSFVSPVTGGRRIYPFGFTAARLLRLMPVGYAVNVFNTRYGDLSTDLLSQIEDYQEDGIEPDPLDLGDLWICRNDAQNYVIVGDPAVRLRLG